MAMKAATQGHRVRRTEWQAGVFCHLGPDGVIKCDTGVIDVNYAPHKDDVTGKWERVK